MVDTAYFSAHDYDGEPTSMTINVPTITAANHDALATLVGTLRTASLALMKGGWDKSGFNEILFNTPVPNTDPYAQREIKFAIIVQPVTGDPYLGNELPMANLDLLVGGSPYIVKNGDVTGDDTGGNITDWVAAYEAAAVDKNGGALVVKDIYQVGRNI